MLKYAASERNKNPILKKLVTYMKDNTFALEIASGTGQHVAYFAQNLPKVKFQPTEVDPKCLGSIKSYIEHYKINNVDEPVYLDVRSDPSTWIDGKLSDECVDYIINSNMIHISAFTTCSGLFKGCGTYLKKDGLLFLYGPFAYDGVISPESNVNFNKSLKSNNPRWGLRDVNLELLPLASKYHLNLYARHRLPANNDLLVWKKSCSLN